MNKPVSWESQTMFDPGPATPQDIATKTIERPVWSENKAQLVARYLHYFVFITRHGTYIDAFAGPQTNLGADAWAAELVLGNEPAWLRHFHLFDEDPTQAQFLRGLAAEHRGRDVQVHEGNSNTRLPEVLPVGSIPEGEATFCLLDQRTFECAWKLCEHIAVLRPGDTKVEQFYFLADAWLPRAIAAISTDEGERRVVDWLGSDDWQSFVALSSAERAEVFVEKFRHELGYRSVKPWPIYQRAGGGGRTMYYMIHATDHVEAPKLMYRAYVRAVDPPEPADQLEMFLDDVAIDTGDPGE